MTQSALIEAPPGIRRGNEKLIRLTPKAGAQALLLRDREKADPYLRVAITGGGCNGLSYKLKFTAKTKPSDIFVESQGVSCLIDAKSALYLKGSLLDYSDSLVAGGFKFSNPNASASCSCGESFNL